MLANHHQSKSLNMFESLPLLPNDPILNLIAAFQQDSHQQKVDLGVGVYKDETGNAPILPSVKQAEKEYLSQQNTKTYTGIAGDLDFNHCIQQLLFGPALGAPDNNRLKTIQTPGSSGGLFVAFHLIARSNPNATVWVSQPTWDNHYAIIEGTGLKTATYPYYRMSEPAIDFEQMMETLATKPQSGDVILLHGCCHNPSGADLSEQQWRELTQLVLEKNLVPVIDQAYQGFALSLDSDAFGIRHMAEHLPELIVSASCSKNFTVYKERTGCVSVLSQNNKQSGAVLSQLLAIARSCYSLPPANGAAIVKTILMSKTKTAQWTAEVEAMRLRILTMRQQLTEQLQRLNPSVDYHYMLNQHGMFSFLPLSKEQITQLREQHSVYLVGSGRISFTGLTPSNINYAAKAIAEVSKGA
ncbi:MAG: aspartate aminotransferase [Pseudohongiellaceae bacterium]|jgi:aspartate aminotransferase